MACVWPVYEGPDSTSGGPWDELPLDDAIRVLKLTPQHFRTPLTETPKVRGIPRDMPWAGYRHVFAEVGEDEAGDPWKAGFYQSPLSPSKVFFRLLEHRIEQQLGANWRAELKAWRDADGDPSVMAWITLRAGAPETEWAHDNRERLRDKVRNAVAEKGVSDWVFVRFRKQEDEERAAS